MKKLQSKKVKHSSIFIRANSSEELQLITKLKATTSVKAASQAFLRAGVGYLEKIKEVDQLNKELEKVTAQLHEANRVLARLHNANTVLGAYGKKFLGGKHIQEELF